MWWHFLVPTATSNFMQQHLRVHSWARIQSLWQLMWAGARSHTTAFKWMCMQRINACIIIYIDVFSTCTLWMWWRVVICMCKGQCWVMLTNHYIRHCNSKHVQNSLYIIIYIIIHYNYIEFINYNAVHISIQYCCWAQSMWRATVPLVTDSIWHMVELPPSPLPLQVHQ